MVSVCWFLGCVSARAGNRKPRGPARARRRQWQLPWPCLGPGPRWGKSGPRPRGLSSPPAPSPGAERRLTGLCNSSSGAGKGLGWGGGGYSPSSCPALRSYPDTVSAAAGTCDHHCPSFPPPVCPPLEAFPCQRAGPFPWDHRWLWTFPEVIQTGSTSVQGAPIRQTSVRVCLRNPGGTFRQGCDHHTRHRQPSP